MRQTGVALTDDDLTRLARLGATDEQIAEAAGVTAVEICRRLAAASITGGERPRREVTGGRAG